MQTTICVLSVVVVALLLLTGCASRGRALRPSSTGVTETCPTANAANAYYIESKPQPGEPRFSCSFVEFDERGDYLHFPQHREAYEKIKQLGTSGERLLVILYVHGWKNNPHSGDVVKFNHFLQQLAGAPFVREGKFRVHGVFLGWRGNSFRHALDTGSTAFKATEKAFGEPIVNLDYARGSIAKPLFFVPEQLSYWSRKNAAEDKVSGISIIRTILVCGHAARRYGNTNSPNRVFLLGHSFGALMLEQSFAPASLASLTAEWPWDDEGLIEKAEANPLPFDLVMFVNSAAPSIYAKQFHGYMVGHREALARNKVIGVDAPLFISLTSAADQATAIAHKWGNILAPFYPSLWRRYEGNDFILDMPADARPVSIPQHYYYRRTPGHNPLLVNHWIVRAREDVQPGDGETQFHQNLDLGRRADVAKRTFKTSPRKAGRPAITWRVTTTPPDMAWSTYEGYKPVFLGPKAIHSGYWIIRCPKEIISGHNDIWNQQAMETYAALFREAEYLRTQPASNVR